MSEHLKLWPKILGEHYICNAAGYRDGKQKLTKDQVYMLYENFLVCSFGEDDVVRFSYEIPIGFIPVQRNRL